MRCADVALPSLFPYSMYLLHQCSAVGTVIPREGALSEAISKLLVVCTTHEVALLGAHFSDRHATLGLNPLPLFSAATDEPICAVASTASGRIFVGGLRGNIYEVSARCGKEASAVCCTYERCPFFLVQVEYGVAGWRGRRCALVCVTPGLQRWIPPLVRDIVHAALPLWGRQEDAIEQLVVDDTSSTLVARTRMGLSVFHVHSMHRARR